MIIATGVLNSYISKLSPVLRSLDYIPCMQ